MLIQPFFLQTLPLRIKCTTLSRFTLYENIDDYDSEQIWRLQLTLFHINVTSVSFKGEKENIRGSIRIVEAGRYPPAYGPLLTEPT